MTVLERIKETARLKKNISLTVLEQQLGYSNGSLAKAKDIPSSRVMEIADFLNVSMDFLMTGEDNRIETPVYNDEHIELITLYSKLDAKQKEAVLNLVRSFSK